MKHTGSPPAQDYIGQPMTSLYINGLGDKIIPENHNPRGWSGYVVGDQLVFGTLEYATVYPQNCIYQSYIRLCQCLEEE